MAPRAIGISALENNFKKSWTNIIYKAYESEKITACLAFCFEKAQDLSLEVNKKS